MSLSLPVTPAAPETTVTAGGEAFGITRGWPGKRGERVFELRDAAGRLRAATLAPGVKLPVAVDGTPVDLDGHLDVLPPGRDRKLPSLSAGADLVVHRAGRRAVERRPGAFVKHLRSGRAEQVARTSRSVGALAARAGFAVPEVLDADDAQVTFSVVPGTPLLDLPADDWARAWRRFAQVWPRLVREPATGVAFGTHTAQDETEVVRQWCGHLRAYDPAGVGATCSAELAAAENRAVELLDATVAGEPVLTHRDLHDGQLLFAPDLGTLGLLDFDTAVVADRELDLANLDVHLQLRVAQGLLDPDRASQTRAALAGAAEDLGADRQRLRAYRVATWVRLAGVYAFRPQWAPLAVNILRAVA